MRDRRRVEPGPAQESVWDYPRPPRLEPSAQRIRIEFNGATIADTQRGQRLLETSHPPVYYLPPEDVRTEFLLPTNHRSFCEWKGQARYYTVAADGQQAPNAAWDYPEPPQQYAAIRNYLAFYPAQMTACYVGAERVQPQAGRFYGGWITSNIVGPFKGAPGSWGW